ncbi:MAG: response regulator [Geothrix sp.]|uniref:HD domain-containing phosphohydrolase n=1 Tax=Geothrix sp. TaxID=1962974 RepID=UPI0017C29935|nr:HD domain-containing phosphohydrolase [Geothrix sp.]NWJ39933.1 response regulator [Geothrix sp.]WIL22055.1 MAG: response regulator [Geothrix sp.]
MTHRTLLVDDDRNILSGYQRVLRKNIILDVAQGGQEALRMLLEQGPYGVVVADMQMPGMSGLELLAKAQFACPDTVRIMLTGNTDQKTAADAVNQGQVFRFLTKPCSPQDLELAIHAGQRQYDLVRAERELLEGTLTGAIEVLAELLASVDPAAFSLGLSVRGRCGEVARALGSGDVWAIEVAAMLAPIGRIALPREVLKAEAYKPETQAILIRVPELGASMIQTIPRLESVADIIRYQAKGFDGSGIPEEGLTGEDIPLGARILKAVQDFTTLETQRHSGAVALEELKLHGKAYDPAVLKAMEQCFGNSVRTRPAPRLVRREDLVPGLILAGDLHTTAGQLVLGQGLRLGHGHLELLRNLVDILGIPDRIPVLDGPAQG